MPAESKSEAVWRWVVCVLTTLTVIVATVVVALVRPVWHSYFAELDVALPKLTMLALAFPIWQCLAVVAVILIAKECLLKNAVTAIAVNALVASAIIFLLALYIMVMAWPVMQIASAMRAS